MKGKTCLDFYIRGNHCIAGVRMSRPMINASVKEAVQQGNLSRMKIYLVNIIKFDPCFRTTEFWDSAKYV